MTTEIHKASLAMTFDNITRCFAVLNDATAEEECVRILRLQEQFHQEYTIIVQEKQRIRKELDNALKSLADYETKLFHARRLLEMEGKSRREAEHEREVLEKRLVAIGDVLQRERNLEDETKHKLAVLNTLPRKRKSKCKHLEEKYGNDINSTGSFLSDLSITQSEDDFLDVQNSSQWFSHRPSLPKNQVPCVGMKRSRLSGGNLMPLGAHSTPPVAETARRSGVRRSLVKHLNNKMQDIGAGDAPSDMQQQQQVHNGQNAERICATTKVTIPQDGTGIIRAESTIESMPVTEMPQNNMNKKKSENNFISPATPYKQATAPPMTPLKTPKTPMAQTPQASSGMMRQHNFTSKTFITVDTCMQCQKRIRFGAVGLRCRDCHVRVHPDCRYLLNVSCAPTTATLKGGNISDHAPAVPPMVPAIIVHCVHEIETRGLKEEGMYRLSRTEREIKALMERFKRSKGCAPYLGNIDIHVLCGCVKDFLRSLREPLIPTNLWKDFCNAAQNPNEMDIEKDLYKAIDALPQANRDTLAFLILHFQRIAECEEVRMPIENLARIFGPTIVGYSSADPNQHAIFTEVYAQYQVMYNLLKIPTAYWTQFTTITEDNNKENDNLAQTPCRNKQSSIYSLYASPLKNSLKKRKFYATPPCSARK